jgi:glycosyltransferase involved in cell wall biosynthesis
MGEGFGLPIAEAQACGTPAFATDSSTYTDLLPDPVQRLKVKDIWSIPCGQFVELLASIRVPKACGMLV